MSGASRIERALRAKGYVPESIEWEPNGSGGEWFVFLQNPPLGTPVVCGPNASAVLGAIEHFPTQETDPE